MKQICLFSAIVLHEIKFLIKIVAIICIFVVCADLAEYLGGVL